MGIQGSASSQLQAFPSQNWQEVQASGQANQPVHYGKYKLYINTITYEQVESYSLHFQSNEECQEYLLLFRKRLKDEHFVNSRFIDLQNINICGCGKLANVYLEHIPIRLVDIREIQEQDYLYVLLSALKGFQKLYNLNGYFRPCAEMIGFDIQGRLKVWFNPNFSKTFINTFLGQSFTDLTLSYRTDYQEQMIWEIIELVSAKPPNQSAFNRFQQIFQIRPGEQLKLSFNLAKARVLQYAENHKIQIKKYFDSILPFIRHMNQSSQQFIPDRKSMDIDGSSFHPIRTKNKIIYYVNPFQASQGDSSQSDLSDVQPYKFDIQQSSIVYKSSIASDSAPMNTQTYFNQQVQFRKLNRAFSQHSEMSSSRKMPRIKFNYNNYYSPHVIALQPYFYSTNDSSSYLGGNKVGRAPHDMIAKREKVLEEKSIKLGNHANYQNIFDQLQLNEEIKTDLIEFNKI